MRRESDSRKKEAPRQGKEFLEKKMKKNVDKLKTAADQGMDCNNITCILYIINVITLHVHVIYHKYNNITYM